ncbi:MAG: hypothetical protein LBO79_04415, partial [Zoogloeaceae bacterium]|nr:hypothetical protein [Zoogloeaceae bacterium]
MNTKDKGQKMVARRFAFPALRCPSAASLALLLLALASHAPALPLAAWPCLFLALSSRLLPRRAWAAGLRLLFLAGVVLAFGFSHGWL